MTFLQGNEKVASALERLKSLMETETKLVGSLTYSTLLKTSDNVARGVKSTERSEKAIEGITTAMNGKYALENCNTLVLIRSTRSTVY